jgi:hypothetical protein
MPTLLIRPPKPELLLSQPTGTLNLAVVFKVKEFDPHKHPRGYKGLFIETPDKIKATDAKPGDVIVAKSGKVFKVDVQTPKGVKVNPVDQDSGEVKSGYTVLHNDLQVGVVEAARGIGTEHNVGDLAPGTVIQTLAGKRFEISKHGKWTTVYPVNDQGERVGKHTVLPPQTRVRVAPKVNGQVTPQVIQAVQAQAAAPSPRTPKQKGDRTWNKLRVLPGDKIRGLNTGTEYEVKETKPNGDVLVENTQGLGREVVDQDVYEKVAPEETLPANLANPPRPYAAGVGRDTHVEIREVVDWGASTYATSKAGFEVRRVGNGVDELLSTANSQTAARKIARNLSENHEAVVERTMDAHLEPQPGEFYLDSNGFLRVVDRVEKRGNKTIVYPTTGPGWMRTGGYTMTPSSLRVVDHKALDQFLQSHSGITYGPETRLGPGDLAYAREFLSAQGFTNTEVRRARPNLFVPELAEGLDPTKLAGQPKADAIRLLKKLGFAEVQPRETNMTKLVNARGRRVHLHHPDNTVTLVDEIKVRPAASGSGTGAFMAQLQAVMDSGGDVRPLDPRKSGNPEEGTALTRTLLYDMALGKQNGVEKVLRGAGGTVKVKSDAAYLSEIQKDPSFPSKQSLSSQVDEPGLNVPVRADVMATHWNTMGPGQVHLQPGADDGPELATVAIAIGERNGMAQYAKDTYGPDYKTAAAAMASDYRDWRNGVGRFDTLAPSQRDYVINTLQEVETRGQRQWQLRQTEFDRRLDAIYHEKIEEETRNRRWAEGTVPYAPGSAGSFELPLWDEVDLEAQDLGDVGSLVQNAPPYSQVPFFFTGGVLRDGVAYAMNDRRRIEAKADQEWDDTIERRLRGAGMVSLTANTVHPSPPGRSINATSPGIMLRLDDGGDKTIEYVPHNTHGQSAPTNQRGRITLRGYTPEEAATRLKDLGLVHDVEEEVPFTSIMRAQRRYGVVAPLHPDYVSGEAPLPEIPTGIHTGVASMGHFEKVLDGGGLLPQAERFKLGIQVSGTIMANDVRGGVDHVVFAGMADASSYYGIGQDGVDVVLKDSAFLRRDILVTDRNFTSGGNTRYPSYRTYQNRMRQEAGIRGPAADVNIYQPLEPAARVAHIEDRTRAASAGGWGYAGNINEWNLAQGVPIEDMAVVVAGNAAKKRQIDAHLDRLLREGRISERPEVRVAYGDALQRTTRR